jgi:rare lipoprotein A
MRPDLASSWAGAPAAARGLLLVACLCLGACASRPGHFYQDDGPPDHEPASLAATPDAVPRVEPLNKRANRPYSALGRSYTPDTTDAPFEQRGMASWYGRQYHGNTTASGEPYDMFAMSAAHPTLPIPSYARVTRVSDGRSVIVRVNDRGPFLQDRVIDLSYAAAARLGIVGPGSGEVRVQKITTRDIAAGTYGARPPPADASVPAGNVPAPATPALATEEAISTRVVAAAGPVAPAVAPPSVAAPARDEAPPGTADAVAIAPAQATGMPPATTQASAPAASPGAPEVLPGAAAVPPSEPAPLPAATAGRPKSPAVAPAGGSATLAGKWSVQLGAFAVLANAEALRDQLAALLARPEAEKLPAASRQPRIEFDGRLHRVLVGAFDVRGTAQSGARQLQRYLSRDTALYQR